MPDSSYYTAHVGKSPMSADGGESRIPAELRERPQWICYRLKPKPDGKTDKIPTDPESGQNIAAQNPDNWTSFERAAAYVGERDHVDGVGFVLTARDGFACIDLDGCVTDGQPDEWATGIIKALDSYAEISPSGRGVHVWVYGDVPDVGGSTRPTVGGRRIEVYGSGRFITVTGKHLRGTPADIGSAYRVIASWYDGADRIAPNHARTDLSHAPTPPDGTTVEEIIARLDGERNPEKFRRLFYGEPNPERLSEDDGALLWKIVFYTARDVDLAEAVMRRSALVRDKWDETRRGIDGQRTTWLRWEIQKAVAARDSHDSFSSWGYYPPVKDEKERKADDSFSSLDQPPGEHDGKKKPLRFLTLAELVEEAGEEVDYVAAPYFARGGITDLSGPAKRSGKTTFTLELVRALLEGKEFLSHPTAPARVLYLTEQGANFVQAAYEAGLDPEHPGLKVLPYHMTGGYSWPEIVDAVGAEAERFDADLVVIDTLNRFAGLEGEQENQSGHVAGVMNPLIRMAQSGNRAVLTIRHANKEGKGRGSTQFDHDVDQLLSLRRPQEGNFGDNVRVLESYGRYDNTTRKIELTEDGYRDLGEEGDAKRWQAVKGIRDALTPSPEYVKASKIKADLKDAGISDKTIDRALDWMFKAAVIDKTRLDGRGKPWAYKWEPLVSIELPGEKPTPNESYDKVMSLTA